MQIFPFLGQYWMIANSLDKDSEHLYYVYKDAMPDGDHVVNFPGRYVFQNTRVPSTVPKQI